MALAHPEIAGLTDWRPLARGGFATVWRARQETLDRAVAVKVDQRTLDDERERRRFLREAGAAGRMSGHRAIVTVHDAGILADGRPFLVMELCPGGSLTSWLKEGQRRSQEEVRDIGVKIADALAAAHAVGVLHRDVKPANIMIDAYGQPGLADFGLAAVPQPGQDISVTMEALTPAYAPREVLYQKPPSEYGDVFSLAATLYALLGGKPPRWPESGTPSLPEIFELQNHPVERLPGVHPPFMDVLMKALADDPAARPSAAEFRDELAAVDFTGDQPPPTPPAASAEAGGAGVSGPGVSVAGGSSAVGSGAAGATGRRRSRVPVLIAVVSLLLVGAVVVGMALAGMRSPVAVPPVAPTAGPTSQAAPSTTAPTSAAPTASPTATTTPPPPEGFVECSELLGPGAYCPTEPECWFQYTSVNDFPAVANPTSCDESHTDQTFAAGRIAFRPRLQSQLERDPLVSKLCTRASARKVVEGISVERDWTANAYPPQEGSEGYFRCFAVTGEARTSPFEVRTR